MPVVLKQASLLDVTLEAVSHLTTSHDAMLYLICNGLHVCSEEELGARVGERFRGQVSVVNEAGVIRSVAGSWNDGAQRAFRDGADYAAVVANDALLREGCLDRLVAFGRTGTAQLWSGISTTNRERIDASQLTDGADFTCFMFGPETIQHCGWFDTNFKPAYFEDNDYYARVVLGGGACRVVHAAQFYHHGSMTIRQDPEAAHHVGYWFGLNRAYFTRKWGVTTPAGSSAEVLEHYYRHPFNDPGRPLSWFPENGNP